MIKNLRFKSFLLPGIILGLVILTAIFFLWPKIGEIGQLKQKLTKDKKILAILTEKTASLQGLGEAELRVKAEKMAEVLPAEKEVTTVLTNLKNLASQTGVSLETIQVNPGELATASAQADLAFNLRLRGEKDQLRNFLKETEQVSPFMRVTSFTLSQASSGELFEVVLDLNSFFLSLPKTLGSIETPVALLSPQEEKIYQELASFKSVAKSESFPLMQSGKEDLFSF